MYYKEELQIKNGEKLQSSFEKDNVPQFIQEFFYGIASRAGRINYWSTIKACLQWAMENKVIEKDSLSDICPEDLDNIRSPKMILYFDYLKYKQGIALTTLQTKKNYLSSFWSYLVREQYVGHNIIHSIKSDEFKPAKTNRKKMLKMPRQQDINTMLEKMSRKNDLFIRIRNPIVVRVLRVTGLRESELAGLDVNDLFLDSETPYILVISKGSYQYDEDGKDIVYLTKDATDALQEWMEFRKTLHVQNQKAVFLNKNGNRMNEDNIKKMFSYYSDGKISPHMMRHDYITTISKETDITFAAEQARHKSTNITISTYDSGASRSLQALQNL